MPYCLDGGTQLCFGRGEVLEPLPAPAQSELAVLLLKHPQVSVSTPWAYGRCRAQREDFYLREEADFAERRQQLRQGDLLGALRGERAFPPIRNDLQQVVAPEVESVEEGLDLLRTAGKPLAVAMSGSGPSLFALHPDLESAMACQAELAPQLDGAGFHSWACRLRPQGVSLEG
jgi:4-diphosphocytidyl-2-C-methyl-D-erythritol kinase